MISILQAYLLFKHEVLGERLMSPAKRHEDNKRRKAIEAVMREYDLEPQVYKRISDILMDEMNKGLGKNSNPKADLKMFPTYVRSLPDGTENGDFLALDLGGTNFRVLLVTLKGTEVKMENKIFPIPEKIMLGTGVQLFDHIASCIAEFMRIHNLVGKPLPLGFTFSFPCKQEGLAIGRLVQWTKGFRCEGVEGENVVQLLQEAIHRRGDIEVNIVAILNDTVGCLMSCAFHDHDCEIGVILGTGTNACYMEKLDKVDLWDADKNEPKQVIINTEWGAFGSSGCLDFIRTPADRNIDEASLNAGKQLYEKMISGMYMGEIARQVIHQCAKDGLLFDGVVSEELSTPHRFYTKYISEIEKDSEHGTLSNTRQVLDELGYDDPTTEDCRNVHYIGHIVGKRAAYLASAGIATLLNRINKPRVTVAVDGSLYRFHPLFDTFMVKKIKELLNPGIEFNLMLSEDGSGKGAALVAAVANRMKELNWTDTKKPVKQ